jgi:hypothetical protein
MTHWVDFLIRCLNAHADTLKLLSEACGEAYVVAALEEESLAFNDIQCQATVRVQDLLSKLPSGYVYSPCDLPLDLPYDEPHMSPYQRLEDAERQCSLSVGLQPLLWSHPFYRALVESHISLDAVWKDPDGTLPEWIFLDQLCHLSIQTTQDWLSALSQTLPLSASVSSLIVGRWIRCRAELLREQGRNPVKSVSRGVPVFLDVL